MDYSGPPGLTSDDAVIEGNGDSEVYALSNLHHSRRIANCVEQIGQQWWGSNPGVHFVNQSHEEDEYKEDGESVSNFDADGDEGLEGDDELAAPQGQEGISLWDILGEGFLKEASQLGIYCSCIVF